MFLLSLPDLALVLLLLGASLFDLRQRRIPNRLLAIGLLVALALHLGSGRPASILTVYLPGFALGLVMFLPLYLLGGMAAGDVKLMATVGAFLGPWLVFQSSLATYCFGGLMALAIVLAKGRWRAAFANVRALLLPIVLRFGGVRLAPEAAPASVGGMPYALAISAGTLTVMVLRHT
ncbi:MAG TPA: prepilin peptidase [Telluria sp.]|jgi:prepilin peptidase CpaA